MKGEKIEPTLTETDATIEAAIQKGAQAAAREAEKGLGIKAAAKVVAPSEGVHVVESTVSEESGVGAPSSGTEKTVDVERAKKGGPRRRGVTHKSSHPKKSSGKNQGKPVPAAVKAEDPAPTNPEESYEGVKDIPEWGVAHASAYESRMTVPAALGEAGVTEARLGAQESVSVRTRKDASVETSAPVTARSASETAPYLMAEAEEEALSENRIGNEKEKIKADADTERVLETVSETEATPIRRDIKQLQGEVAGLRSKYAARRYEHGRMMESLKRSPIGRFFGAADADQQDMDYWKTEYETKLMELREAELGEIKRSGSQGQEFRDAMAGLLHASKFDEAVELVKEQDKYRQEGHGWSEKITNAGRAVGEWYNGLSKWKKYAAGAAMIGLSAVGVSSGFAVAPAAMLVRKIIAGAGLSVMIDAKLDSRTRDRLGEQTRSEAEAELEKIFGPRAEEEDGEIASERTEAEKMSLFEERLRAASGGADSMSLDLARKRRLNGVIAVAAGFGLSFAVPALKELSDESGFTQGAHDLLYGTTPEPVILAEDAHAPGLLDAKHEATSEAMIEKDASIISEQSDESYKSFGEMTDAERLALVTETGDASSTLATESAGLHSRMDFVPEAAEHAESVPAAEPTVLAEDTFTPELKPRVDGWFSQIFRVEGSLPGSGQDWVFDRERIGKLKISDMMRDAVLYQRGEISGYRTGLSVEQLENFAQFFQGAGTGVDNREAMARIIYGTMREDMTVTEYLQKVAPIAVRGKRLGLFTTSV